MFKYRSLGLLTAALLLLSTAGSVLGLGDNPSIATINPPPNSSDVPRNTAINADLYLPTEDGGNGIDIGTANDTSVYLYPTSMGSDYRVPMEYNTSGGDDVLIITPTAILEADTQYTLVVNANLKDAKGNDFDAFTMNFTTGTDGGPTPSPVQFNQSNAGAPNGKYTSVEIGPDGRLYAVTVTGFIRVFDINLDGTLTQVAENSLQYAGRAIIGLQLIDKSPNPPEMWITHHDPIGFAGNFANNFTSKIARLIVSNYKGGLGVETWTGEDLIVGLPRSAKDHLTNSLKLGPDGALYTLQGGNSAMGRKDPTWNNRPETLLSAAMLRIDIGILETLEGLGQTPVDVTTAALIDPLTIDETKNYGYGDPELDTTYYNPLTPGAPVTLYATGIRNAYDMVFHSNGKLYVPGNSSAAGGNTPGVSAGAAPSECQYRPGGGYWPTIPAAVAQLGGISTQPDYMYRVEEDGYYGHPNITRCEFVMSGGDSVNTPNEATRVTEYPDGTDPDPNYKGITYNFGLNQSPNGAVEYQGNAFGDELKGWILVVRYSSGDDIIALKPDANSPYDITQERLNIPGFTGFNNPLDIIENPATGFLYVAEFQNELDPDAGRIVLLKPNVSNNPPVADADGPYTMDRSTTLNVDAANGLLIGDSDADAGDVLTPKLTLYTFGARPTLNEDGSFSITDPAPTLTTNANFFYRANDGTAQSATAMVTVNINNINSAPVTANDTFVATEDTELIVTAANGVLANDSDPNRDSFTAQLVSDVSDGTLALAADGSFSYTPNEEFSGTDSFTYKAVDSFNAESAPATVTITIDSENDSPIVVNDSYQTFANQVLNVSAEQGVLANDSDPEGESLIATIVSGVSHGSLSFQATGAFIYTPAADYIGSDSFSYRATDGKGGLSEGSVTIEVVFDTSPLELLVNGDMETDANEDKVPDGWTLSNKSGEKLICNKDKTGDGDYDDPEDKIKAYEGVCAFQFRGRDGERSKLVQVLKDEAVADIEIGDTIIFNGQVWGRNVIGNATTVKIVTKFVDGTKDVGRATIPSSSYDWQALSSQADPINVTAEVDKIKVILRYRKAGTSGRFRLDALRLTATPVSQLSRMPVIGEPIPLPEAPDGGSFRR